MLFKKIMLMCTYNFCLVTIKFYNIKMPFKRSDAPRNRFQKVLVNKPFMFHETIDANLNLIQNIFDVDPTLLLLSPAYSTSLKLIQTNTVFIILPILIIL